MLTAIEHRLQHQLDVNDKNNELWIKAQGDLYNSSLKELRNVTKERHVLFIQDVKKVWEDVNLKPEELKKEFLSVIHQVNDRYNLIQEKVDIIVGVVTNFIQSFQATVPTFEAKALEDKN